MFISKMEGNLEKDSISEWRKKKREKKNASKKKYYLENREMLAEKARQRMKRLRKKQKLAKLRGRVGVATRCTSKEKNVSQAKAIQACAKRIEKKREEEREQLRKEQKRRQTSARANKYREKRKRLENQAGQEPEPEVECVTPSGPAFTSRTAKKRAKDKVTPTLPKLPRKKAEVVQTLADSPGTKIILEKRGFLQSSSERQDTQAMKSVVADLADGLARVHDCYVFMTSENYTCRSQDEIQLQYFDPNKVSIHVTILYRHADLLQDGKQSTADESCIIKEHVFALSDDNTQDYNFVHHVQSQILSYLREQHHLTVDKIHEFTDGCAGQYKSKHTFGDLSCCLADFGVQIDRHFFETSVCPYNQI